MCKVVCSPCRWLRSSSRGKGECLRTSISSWDLQGPWLPSPSPRHTGTLFWSFQKRATIGFIDSVRLSLTLSFKTAPLTGSDSPVHFSSNDDTSFYRKLPRRFHTVRLVGERPDTHSSPRPLRTTCTSARFRPDPVELSPVSYKERPFAISTPSTTLNHPGDLSIKPTLDKHAWFWTA